MYAEIEKKEGRKLRKTNFENIFCSEKKIIIAGGGEVTESLLLNAERIDNLLCICDRKAPANEGMLMGYPYMQNGSAVKKYSDFYVAISSLKYYKEIKADWMQLVPEEKILPYLNWETRWHFNMERSKFDEWLHKNSEKIAGVYDLLADEASKRSLCYFLQGMEYISADDWLQVAYHSVCIADYFSQEYFKFDDKTVYVDIGGFDGDTVFDFIRVSNRHFRKIIACEPDERNFYVMQNKLSELKDERIICANVAVGKKNGMTGFAMAQNPFLNTVSDEALRKVRMVSIDSLNEPATMIKVSVAGEQNNLDILEGAKDCIKKYKPQMSFVVSMNEDLLISVPLKILEICDSYKIYFRLTSYSQGVGQRFSGCIYATANEP